MQIKIHGGRTCSPRSVKIKPHLFILLLSNEINNVHLTSLLLVRQKSLSSLLVLMPKRSKRSSGFSSSSKPSPKRNKLRSEEMEDDQHTNRHLSMKILFNKLTVIESRMEDNFSNLHLQIAELTWEFKEEINGIKSTLIKAEKSLNNAWASIVRRSSRKQIIERFEELPLKNVGRTSCWNFKSNGWFE